MEVRPLQCSRCGALQVRGNKNCAECGIAFVEPASLGSMVRALQRGKSRSVVDLVQNPLPNAVFKTGRMERVPGGVQINIPAGASYMDHGEGGSSEREGCVAVIGQALDDDAAFGVISRLRAIGSGRVGYALVVHPSAQTYCLFHFYLSVAETQFHVLRPWEKTEFLRGNRQPNVVELRVTGTLLQPWINGRMHTSVRDDRCSKGTSGWFVRSVGAEASVLLQWIERASIA